MLRRSTVIVTRWAMTLTRLGNASSRADRRHLRATEPDGQGARLDAIEAATTIGSRRSRIGVVPAWADRPVIVSSLHEMPCTPVTAPMRDALVLQHRALLDVQLDERVRRRARHGHRAGVADPFELVADSCTVDADRVECVLDPQPTDVDEAAHHVGREPGALLVGEEADGDRAAGFDAGPLQRLDHLQPGEHPEVAVVATAGTDGVDVGTHHHRCAFAGPPRGDHVADAVDRHVEAEVAHPGHHELAPGAIVVAERQAAASATLDRTDLGQRFQTLEQAVDVDPQAEVVGGAHLDSLPTAR